jgi:hypothetical protein
VQFLTFPFFKCPQTHSLKSLGLGEGEGSYDILKINLINTPQHQTTTKQGCQIPPSITLPHLWTILNEHTVHLVQSLGGREFGKLILNPFNVLELFGVQLRTLEKEQQQKL